MLKRSRKVIKISGRRGRTLRLDDHVVVIAVCIAIVVGILLAFIPNAYKITVDGVVVGAIKDKKVIENAMTNVITQLEGEYKTEVKFETEPEIKKYKAKKKDYIDPNYLVTYMRKNMDILINFKEIVVDGKTVGIVASEDKVEELKERLKKRYYGDKDYKVDFDKDVEVKDVFAKESELTDMETLVEVCAATTPKAVTYTVKSGDTLYGIALSLGITVENLISANEGFTESTVLKVGTEIKANVYEPLLPLIIIQNEQVEETADETNGTEVAS